MKKVVINGGGSRGALLTPKWTVEYLKRKGINVYTYIIEEHMNGDVEFVHVDKDKYDYTVSNFYIMYLTQYLGKRISDTKENIRMVEECIFEDDLFEDREHAILVELANEINDEKIIRVIEIPEDVDYEIKDVGILSSKEYIVEKHRTWY